MGPDFEPVWKEPNTLIDPISRRRFLGAIGTAAAFAPSLRALTSDSTPDSASARQGPTHGWLIETTSIARAIEVDPAGGLQLKSLKHLTTGHEWAMPGYADFAFAAGRSEFEGLGPRSGFRLAGNQTRKTEKNATELCLDFINQENLLKLSLFYTSFPDTSVIEQRCRLENIGTQTISGVSRFDPIFFALRGHTEEFQVRAFTRGQYTLENWPIEQKLEIRGASVTTEHAGFIAIEHRASREILFMGIQWERDWAIRFTGDSGKVQIGAGLTNFSHDLAPEEALESPRIFLGVTHGDLDAASNAMHDYLWKYVLPPALKNEPWVVYDIYTTENKDVEQTLIQEIDFAADLGIENVYYDACWYEGSSSNGNGNWGAGLGHYRIDRDKFPKGLDYVSSYAHSKGAKFGLWVDPTVVDCRLIPSEIPKKWVAQNDGKDIELEVHYRDENWAPLTKLCLGDPEVLEHIKSNLSRLINDFHLDWLKWDNSGVNKQPCNRIDHGHQRGDGSYAAMRGEYAIWDYLHENHPDLVLEVCGDFSAQDFGKAPYCRAHWLSDATFPSKHARTNVMAAGYLFPSSYNSTYILREPEVMDQKDPALLDTFYRSRMMGRFGFGSYEVLKDRVSRFPPEVIDAARRNIPTYKAYRHLLAQDCYHLTPPSGSPEGWQAMEFCTRDGSEAVVFIFRNGSTQSAYRLSLKGLHGAAPYRVNCVNQLTESTRLGAELLGGKIVVDLPRGDMSEVLIVKRV
jgi:alpha-galactosidase